MRPSLTALLSVSLLVGCASKPAKVAVKEAAKEAPRPVPRPFPKEMQSGICYAHAWENPKEGGYGTPTDARTLARLKDIGVTWISITPFGFQRKRSSPKITGTTANYAGAESDERIEATTNAAHKLGIKVLLKPHIWVGDSSWCGSITPPDWDVWMESYQSFVEHYAELAETIGADGFVLGNELGTATRNRPEAFRELIRLARKKYSGPITYAANWDEAARIPFWEDLDAIGINAYWPLTKNPGATGEELYEGAKRVEQKIAEIAKKAGRPVILTEIGYRSVVGSGVDPNTWPEKDRDREVDYNAQVMAYRAVLRALWGKPYLRGIYFWKVISDGTWEEEGGPGGFSPLDKPAEEVLREYFLSP